VAEIGIVSEAAAAWAGARVPDPQWQWQLRKAAELRVGARWPIWHEEERRGINAVKSGDFARGRARQRYRATRVDWRGSLRACFFLGCWNSEFVVFSIFPMEDDIKDLLELLFGDCVPSRGVPEPSPPPSLALPCLPSKPRPPPLPSLC
jgi:hypothetical protein